MSHPEWGFRKIPSIPPRTSLDVLRGGVTVRIGRGSLLGGVRRVSRDPAFLDDLRNAWYKLNSFDFSLPNIGRFLNPNPALLVAS